MISELLKENYRVHPSFHSTLSSIELDAALLENFNQKYASLTIFSDDLSQRCRVQLESDCTKALCSAFSQIRSQASDEYEQYFLSELEQEATTLLFTEFAEFRKTAKEKKPHINTVETAQMALQLYQQKHFFTSITKEAVADIMEMGADALNQFRKNASIGKTKRDDLSTNSGKLVRNIGSIVQRDYSQSGVIDAVSTYAGRSMQVGGLAFELSVESASWWKNQLPGLERAPHTLYAHLDESIHVPKSIVYLTDVSADQGPTSCYPGMYESMKLNPLQEIIGRIVGVPGAKKESPLFAYYNKTYHQSIASENFRRHFMRLPESIRFNSHLGWDVYPGSGLEQNFTQCETTMTGNAGTAIVFDGGRLFHRGGLLKQGERVALQVTFIPRTPLSIRIKSHIKRAIS